MPPQDSSNKRIGYFDYRLDNFHAEVYLSALRGPLADRGFEIAGATALQQEPSASWAAERNLPYFETVEALAEEVDYLMVLAPSNPELHLEMCQRAFPLGKPTFVDKTFAPDLATARAIFQLADAHNIQVQSTSALRSTCIQEYVLELPEKPFSIHLCAAGTSFDEYGIHPLELAVSCLGPDVESMMCHRATWGSQFTLVYPEGRTALIDFLHDVECPFSATLTTVAGSKHLEVDGQSLFVDAASSILDFFASGQALIDRRETMVIRRLLDIATTSPQSHAFIPVADIPVTDIPVTEGSHPVPAPHWNSKRESVHSATLEESPE